MTKLDKIKKIEKDILSLESQLKKIYSEHEYVNVGDYVVILHDHEWGPNRGTHMFVESVKDGYILCQDKDPKYRAQGIYWISEGSYAKIEI